MDTLQRLVTTIEGNGRDGMRTTLDNFITEYRTNRVANIEFQDQRDAENAKRETRRWRVLGFVLSLLTVIVAILTYLEANRQIRDHSLQIPSTYEMKRADPVVSYSQPTQDASRF